MADSSHLMLRQIADLAKRENSDPRNKRPGPRTLASWRCHARDRGWDSYGPRNCRMIDGEMAFHVRLLPNELRKLRAATTPPDLTTKAILAERTKIAVQARLRIIEAIEAYSRMHWLSRGDAVLAFVEAVVLASKRKGPREHGQIDGFDLPYTIIMDARSPSRSERSWTVSRSIIYNWNNDPPDRSKRKDKPPTVHLGSELGKRGREFERVMRFIGDAADHTPRVLVERQEPRFVDALRELGYRVEAVEPAPKSPVQKVSVQSRR